MRTLRTIPTVVLAALVVSTGAGAQRRQTARQQPTTVILVRHAEKFTGNPLDQNPPLSPEGWQRARDLYRLLKGRHVQAIITTQLDRTRMTARPAADSLHIVPEELDAQTPAATVAELIRTRHAGQTVLVVGHGNTVTKIIAALGGPTLGDICDSAYSNIFTLVVPRSGTPRLTHAHYGAADPPGDHDCVDGIKEEHHSR